MANLSCGIVGLPNVGKSTLFNALTANAAEASNYPFCTIDPNVGIVDVPDGRLPCLAEISRSQRIVPATMEFTDIAGLVAGAAAGEGLGNKFLSNIRETDAILHVVRCFEDPDVVHVSGGVDPIRDVEVINLELGLADLQSIEGIVQRLEKKARIDKDARPLVELLSRVKAHLDEGKPVRTLDLTDEERQALKSYPFLTSKRVLYVANVAETDLPEMRNPFVDKLVSYAEDEGSSVVPISAQIEQEIAQLDQGERESFLEDLGLSAPGLHRLIGNAYDMLGLISYLTTGEMETRAWPIVAGTNAQLAAGKIHTDIQKGFIRAEVVAYADMVACRGWVGAREAGKSRTEGRDYVVHDGDVILFRHN